MAETEVPDSIGFQVGARTMQMLGRQSISSARVAILELVRNAYDADASLVVVQFRGASTDDGFIVISDDGEGMSFDDLRGKWMLISTDNKSQAAVTRGGRVAVGEKGIGRLGLDRLARYTTLLTSRRDAPILKLVIDWTKYEQRECLLQDVKHPLEQLPNEENGRSGTTLQLTGLRDRWTHADYEALFSDLALLVPPFEDHLIDFKILFDCDEAADLSGVVSSPMAAAAEFQLVSDLTSDGHIQHTLTHRSGEIVEDRRRWHEAFSDAVEGEGPACGPLQVRLYFYVREAATLREIGIKRAELDSFLWNFQGVRIYRDGFRVKPYGDPRSLRGDRDWLGLNERRVQSPAGVGHPIGEWRLAENQVVGSIFVSRLHNPDLLDQTNREGLEENQAFFDLRRIALHGIQFLERERQKRYHREKGKSKARTEVQPILEVAREQLERQAQQMRKKAQDVVGTFASDEAPSLLAWAETTENLAGQLEVAEATYSEVETERQLMLGLATLGIAMSAFGHETTQSITQVLGRAELLRPVIDELRTESAHRAGQNLEALVEFAKRIKAWGQFALDRVNRDKRTRRDIDINLTIETSLKAFEGMLARRNVQVESVLGSELPPLRAFAMDVEAIIINFVTNAITALEPTALPNRRISIATVYDSDIAEFRIIFADSGRGIPDQDLDLIWNPLFSTKVDERGQPLGTGLGLTIVKNVVDEYQGTVRVKGHGALGGAEFEVRIPRRYQVGGRDAAN